MKKYHILRNLVGKKRFFCARDCNNCKDFQKQPTFFPGDLKIKRTAQVIQGNQKLNFFLKETPQIFQEAQLNTSYKNSSKGQNIIRTVSNSFKKKEQLEFCAIFTRTALIFQEGLFQISQEHLRFYFPGEPCPQEQLF